MKQGRGRLPPTSPFPRRASGWLLLILVTPPASSLVPERPAHR